MTLYLIRAPLSLPKLHRWAAERGMVGRHGIDEGQALHHLLFETFGKATLQPFRLFPLPGNTAANLYAYASTSSVALIQTARTIALPEHLTVIDPARLDDKQVPELVAGQRVGFEARLRPVVRLLRDVAIAHPKPQTLRRGAEVDAFYARRLHLSPGAAEPDGPKREEVYCDWLSARLEGAAALDRPATRLATFRRTRSARRGLVEGPDATISGTLSIVDPVRFRDLLARGIGRHRAYGYGMMLLRAPNRPALVR